MTSDIFARACLFHVFSKSGSTINTNFKHYFQFFFLAICCITNTITLSNMHIRFIALNLGTPDRFQKRDILLSSCCHAVLQTFDFLNRCRFVYSVYGNAFGLFVEALVEFHSKTELWKYRRFSHHCMHFA